MRPAKPFVGERFGHGRAAGSSRNASRAHRHRSRQSVDDVRIGARTTADFRRVDFAVDSLTEAQMGVVGVTPEWSAKDLRAHLAYWERAAAEQVREVEAGRSSARKYTRAQVERINREVVFCESGHAKAPSPGGADPSEERNRGGDEPSARETGGTGSARAHRLSQCIRHRRHHLEQLDAWIARLGNHHERKESSGQPSSTARTPGQGLLIERRTIRFCIRGASFPDFFRMWTSVPPRLNETSSTATFIKWIPRPCSASRFSTARGLGIALGSNPFP